ncbi:MAG TPA: hypothetical protein VFN28_09415 [Amaricoccus sp.]|nr:hypothetical protein [Amaricoccus sp.]
MGAGFLLGFALFVALVAVVGGLWVLFRQKVVVDEKGAVSEIDIPLVGKLKTNYPSLVAIMLGIALAWSVQSRLDLVVEVPTTPLNALIDLDGTPEGSQVFVSAVPQKYLRAQSTSPSAGDDRITIDVDEPGPYNVVAFIVTGVSPDGLPVYKVVYGPAKFNAEPRSFEFTATLGGTREEQ